MPRELIIPHSGPLLLPNPALTQALLDHAAAADPHTGYRLESVQLDHGTELVGLADDDHTQYLTEARHAGVHSALHAQRITSDQSITSGTITTVIYNSVLVEDDPDGDLSLNTSTGEITIATAGWYLINAGIVWEAVADATRRYIDITVDGSRVVSDDDFGADSSTPSHHVSMLRKYDATDVVTISAFHTRSPAAARAVTATPRTHVSIARLS